MKVLWFILVLPLLLGSLTAVARDVDIKGASDHPLISRFPDTYISAYHMSDFQEFMVAVGPITPEILAAEGKTALPPVKRYEGKSTVITYKSNSKSTSALRSTEILRKRLRRTVLLKPLPAQRMRNVGTSLLSSCTGVGIPRDKVKILGLMPPTSVADTTITIGLAPVKRSLAIT